MFTLFCCAGRKKTKNFPRHSSSTPLLSSNSRHIESSQVKKAGSDDILARRRAARDLDKKSDTAFKKLLNYLADFDYCLSRLECPLETESSAEQLSELAIILTIISSNEKKVLKTKVTNFLNLSSREININYAYLINHSKSLPNLPLGKFTVADVHFFSGLDKMGDSLVAFKTPFIQLVHDLANRGYRFEQDMSSRAPFNFLAQYAVISGLINETQCQKFTRNLRPLLRTFWKKELYKYLPYDINGLKIIDARQLSYAINNFNTTGRIKFPKSSAPIKIDSSSSSLHFDGDSVSPDTSIQLGLK